MSIIGYRDQPFLLPPDLRDWLPEGHLAWFILDVVDQLDLQLVAWLCETGRYQAVAQRA
jgi:hypothetical protein